MALAGSTVATNFLVAPLLVRVISVSDNLIPVALTTGLVGSVGVGLAGSVGVGLGVSVGFGASVG